MGGKSWGGLAVIVVGMVVWLCCYKRIIACFHARTLILLFKYRCMDIVFAKILRWFWKVRCVDLDRPWLISTSAGLEDHMTSGLRLR